MNTTTRRDFLRRGSKTAGAAMAAGSFLSLGRMRAQTPATPAGATDRATIPFAVTRGPQHHFFGYNDVSPWNESSELMLGMSTTFHGAAPRVGDEAGIGIIDVRNGARRFERVGRTTAWNWQQGCRLQWIPGTQGRKFLFNDCEDNRCVTRIYGVGTGLERTLDRPIYGLSPDGRTAMSVNFPRMIHTLPYSAGEGMAGYGYVGAPDPWGHELAPKDDGIYRMDIASGKSELIISLGQMSTFKLPPRDLSGNMHWFSHTIFSPNGKRFAFIHRARRAPNQWGISRLVTANLDGTDIHVVTQPGCTHFDWCGNEHLTIWVTGSDRIRTVGAAGFVKFKDRSEEYEILGKDTLPLDGHPSYAHNQEWMISDQYTPRQVFLYHPASKRRYVLASLPEETMVAGETRCHMHPRWSSDGNFICFDSAHEGTRQIYAADVRSIVRA